MNFTQKFTLVVKATLLVGFKEGVGGCSSDFSPNLGITDGQTTDAKYIVEICR